jgi:electron transfer flavoprotein alpha subunit
VILAVAEQRDGKLNRASWETLAAAQLLAGGMPVKVVLLGGSVGAAATELAAGGVAEVLVAEHPALAQYTPEALRWRFVPSSNRKRPYTCCFRTRIRRATSRPCWQRGCASP